MGDLVRFRDDEAHEEPSVTLDAFLGQSNATAVRLEPTDDPRALIPHLTADGCVISAQNGLNELAIARVVGEPRTVGAFVNFGADYLEPGVIHYGGRGAVVLSRSSQSS